MRIVHQKTIQSETESLDISGLAIATTLKDTRDEIDQYELKPGLALRNYLLGVLPASLKLDVGIGARLILESEKIPTLCLLDHVFLNAHQYQKEFRLWNEMEALALKKSIEWTKFEGYDELMQAVPGDMDLDLKYALDEFSKQQGKLYQIKDNSADGLQLKTLVSTLLMYKSDLIGQKNLKIIYSPKANRDLSRSIPSDKGFELNCEEVSFLLMGYLKKRGIQANPVIPYFSDKDHPVYINKEAHMILEVCLPSGQSVFIDPSFNIRDTKDKEIVFRELKLIFIPKPYKMKRLGYFRAASMALTNKGIEEQDPLQAERKTNKALRLDPFNDAAHYLNSQLKVEKKDFSSSLREIENALRLNTQSITYYSGLNFILSECLQNEDQLSPSDRESHKKLLGIFLSEAHVQALDLQLMQYKSNGKDMQSYIDLYLMHLNELAGQLNYSKYLNTDLEKNYMQFKEKIEAVIKKHNPGYLG